MTQEEKQLLLKDLCARLPYGVKMSNINAIHNGLDLPPITIDINDYENSNPLILINSGFIPYLRPMSNMTEDEKRQYEELCDEDIRQLTSVQVVHPGLKYKTSCHRSIDWLEAHHFDYRRLIPMDLALEAPEGMYDN